MRAPTHHLGFGSVGRVEAAFVNRRHRLREPTPSPKPAAMFAVVTTGAQAQRSAAPECGLRDSGGVERAVPLALVSSEHDTDQACCAARTAASSSVSMARLWSPLVAN